MIEDWMLRKTVGNSDLYPDCGRGADAGMNRPTFRSGAHHPLGVVFYDPEQKLFSQHPA